MKTSNPFIRYFFLAGLFLQLGLPAIAQNQKKEIYQEQLQEKLEATCAEQNILGASAAVLFNDGSCWTGATGWSHPGNKVEINKNMMFNIGSISKTYLAALAMKVIEEGKLSLEDTIGQWFPNTPHVDPGITIRQLMNHTSGLYDYVKHEESPWQQPFRNTRIYSQQDVLDELMKEPYFEAGTGWHYSNTNYLLLKDIIDQVTGDFHRSFIRKINQPMELNQTTAGISHITVLQSSKSPVYWRKMIGQRWNMTATGMPWEAINYRVLTTARELASFFDKLFHQQEFLSADLMKEMLDYHSPTPNDFPLSGYGLGVCNFEKPEFKAMFGMEEEAIGHFGNGIGYKSAALYFPEYGMTVVVLINEDNVPGLIASISKLVETATKE